MYNLLFSFSIFLVASRPLENLFGAHFLDFLVDFDYTDLIRKPERLHPDLLLVLSLHSTVFSPFSIYLKTGRIFCYPIGCAKNVM